MFLSLKKIRKNFYAEAIFLQNFSAIVTFLWNFPVTETSRISPIFKRTCYNFDIIQLTHFPVPTNFSSSFNHTM